MESDSLIMKNKLINNQLSELLCVLDDDIQKNFIEYNKEIINAQKTAFRLFSIIIIIAIIGTLPNFRGKAKRMSNKTEMITVI